MWLLPNGRRAGSRSTGSKGGAVAARMVGPPAYLHLLFSQYNTGKPPRAGPVRAALRVSTGPVFYHFTNKETLLGEAFGYAAGEDLDRLSATAAGGGSAGRRLGRIPGPYPPAGSSEAWLLWIDAWGQALRSPELAEVSRQLDLRWKQTLAAGIREGGAAGEFTCPDPDAAAWRLTALLDGLGVQVTVHRSVPSARLVDWV